MNLFRDKTIVLGVTGSIAAYKAAVLASQLYQAGAQVYVAMTRAATHFITPLTFESLTHHPVATDVLALGPNSEIEHVALAQRADALLIAPATANTIAKLAHGLADDAVSAIALDTRAPLVVAPAMETGMWENPATQENVAKLRERGITFVEPGTGHLASDAEGTGRLAEPEQIFAALRAVFARHGPLAGQRVVITAGGTHEPIDPVRVITNRSSGKMGLALAQAALERGARVVFITTASSDAAPIGVEVRQVGTTEELRQAVLELARGADALIMAAAPADYRPVSAADHKIKKEASEQLAIELLRTPDILGEVAQLRERQPQLAPRAVVGFAAETDDLLANARSKLERKRLDLIVANPVPQTFGSDRVQATLLNASGGINELEPMTKERLAEIILDEIAALLMDRAEL
jgi:phosphopantothenoylcysteine decarboxylase / phosphopantothenate---cysteine ligase